MSATNAPSPHPIDDTAVPSSETAPTPEADTEKPTTAAGGDRVSRLDIFIANPRRALWGMAIPIMAGMFLHIAYNIVDAAYLGNYGGDSDVLAAMPFIRPIFFVMVALTSGLGTGITAVVATAIGKRSHEEADRACSNAISLMLTLGVVYCVVGLLFGRLVIDTMRPPAAQGEYAWQYCEIIFWSAPLFFFGTAIRMALTGEGDARTPMMVLAVGILINIILDPIFIFTLDLGIQGAAWATLVSQGAASLGLAYLFFFRKRSFLRFSVRGMRPDGPTLRGIFGIGLPTSAGQLLMAVGAGFLAGYVGSYGASASAAYGVGFQFDMLVGLPILALATGAVTVIGMFRGAKRVDLIRSTTAYTIRAAIVIGLLLGASVWVLSPIVLPLFMPTDPEGVAVGTQYLSFMVCVYPLMAIGMACGRILQGLGRGMPALLITFIRVIGLAVPGAAIVVLVLDWPIAGIWGALLTSALVAATVAVLWIRHAVWKTDPTEGIQPNVEHADAAAQQTPTSAAGEIPRSRPADPVTSADTATEPSGNGEHAADGAAALAPSR